MRDIPVFATQYGVASLTLSQIPYTQEAYIKIQDSGAADLFLQECCDFCRAAGAEKVYATGHDICQNYPVHTAILLMRADRVSISDTDAALFPVTDRTLEQWRQIYNNKVLSVPNGAWLTIEKSKAFLAEGDCYFVHRDDRLLGIGKASLDQIFWVASVEPGAGLEVVKALCHALTGDSVVLEVASTNTKALSLYEKLGFITTSKQSVWYRIQ